MVSHDIAVVLPVFQFGHYLSRAINSVLNQTYPAKEICIVDDGSTDSSVREHLAKFSDPRIKVIHLETNQGLSVARNIGVRNTSSQYLAFLDADDYWDPNKLEKQALQLEQNSNSIVGTSLVFHHNEGPSTRTKKENIKSPLEILFNELFLMSPSSMMLHRKHFELLKGFDENLHFAEDWDFLIRAALQNIDLIFVNDYLTHHQIHSQSLSRSYDARSDISYLRRKLLQMSKNDSRVSRRMIARSLSSFSRWIQTRSGRTESIYYLLLAFATDPTIVNGAEYRGNVVTSLLTALGAKA